MKVKEAIISEAKVLGMSASALIIEVMEQWLRENNNVGKLEQ